MAMAGTQSAMRLELEDSDQYGIKAFKGATLSFTTNQDLRTDDDERIKSGRMVLEGGRVEGVTIEDLGSDAVIGLPGPKPIMVELQQIFSLPMSALQSLDAYVAGSPIVMNENADKYKHPHLPVVRHGEAMRPKAYKKNLAEPAHGNEAGTSMLADIYGEMTMQTGYVQRWPHEDGVQVVQALYGKSVSEVILIPLEELLNQSPRHFMQLVEYALPYALLYKHSGSAVEVKLKYQKEIDMGRTTPTEAAMALEGASEELTSLTATFSKGGFINLLSCDNANRPPWLSKALQKVYGIMQSAADKICEARQQAAAAAAAGPAFEPFPAAAAAAAAVPNPVQAPPKPGRRHQDNKKIKAAAKAKTTPIKKAALKSKAVPKAKRLKTAAAAAAGGQGDKDGPLNKADIKAIVSRLMQKMQEDQQMEEEDEDEDEGAREKVNGLDMLLQAADAAEAGQGGGGSGGGGGGGSGGGGGGLEGLLALAEACAGSSAGGGAAGGVQPMLLGGFGAGGVFGAGLFPVLPSAAGAGFGGVFVAAGAGAAGGVVLGLPAGGGVAIGVPAGAMLFPLAGGGGGGGGLLLPPAAGVQPPQLPPPPPAAPAAAAAAFAAPPVAIAPVAIVIDSDSDEEPAATVIDLTAESDDGL